MLPAKRLYYVGLRDVEVFEYSLIRKHKINAYAISDVEKYGIHKVTEMILESMGNKHNIHISFDIDSLDPSVAPSTGTSVSGGLTLREVFYVLEEMHKTGKVTGFDITEINPLIGENRDANKTLEVGIQTIKSVLGYKRF